MDTPLTIDDVKQLFRDEFHATLHDTEQPNADFYEAELRSSLAAPEYKPLLESDSSLPHPRLEMALNSEGQAWLFRVQQSVKLKSDSDSGERLRRKFKKLVEEIDGFTVGSKLISCFELLAHWPQPS
jgi:hypothetical protein